MDAPSTQEKEHKKVLPVGDISHSGFSMVSIKIQDGSVEELEGILRQKIDRSSAAYNYSSIVVNVEDVINLNNLDFLALQECCRKHNLFLVGVTGIVNEDRANAMVRRRIPVVNSNRYARIREENIKPKILTQYVEQKVPVCVPIPYEIKVPYKITLPEPVKVVRGPIRSGEVQYGHNCSIAIYGSVRSLARIIADHHVFIFGDVLGGEILAGAMNPSQVNGRRDSIIHIQGKFTPGVLAIADKTHTPEELYNSKRLTRIREHEQGLFVSLEQGELHYISLSELTNDY